MKHIFLFLALLSTTCFAQTKKIAFKSHSGNSANYFSALNNSLFDNCSNFGMAPERYTKRAKLDSIIFISDTKAILVTSSTCHDTYEQTSTKWKPGREYAIKHPLYSKQHSLDSIKTILKQQYYFQNSIDSVKFIGYDNAKPSSPSQQSEESYKKENDIPLVASPNQKPPRPNYPLVLVSIIGLLSIFVGLIRWKINKIQNG